MSKLAWIALLALVLAGCAGDNRDRSASSGGSSVTTAPAGSNEDMRGSKDTAPGDEGDRLPPRGSPAPSNRY
jgi:PBP1b-binding outer membrane lipoprotein LpoB